MPYLLRRPSGYYFRLRVPQSLRLVVQKRFLVFALRTHDKAHANLLSAQAYFNLRACFQHFTFTDMARQPGEPPLQELLESIKKNTTREAMTLQLPDGAVVRGDTKAEFDHATATYKKNFQGRFKSVATPAPAAALAPCPTISKMRGGFILRWTVRASESTVDAYDFVIKLFEEYFNNRPMNQISVTSPLHAMA